MDYKFMNIKELKTYKKVYNNTSKINKESVHFQQDKKAPLTTQNAIKYLLEGTLRLRVCRYCLIVTNKLSELDEILTLAINGSFHDITIRDIIASFHPFKVSEDPNFPNKICTECVNRAISCYLFSQQCERAERALRNCFDDINDKFEKLDPVEPVKKRGKRKLNPNYDTLYTEHKNVINYAEPIINIINIDSTSNHNSEISDLECPKCWQVLPNMELLLNHEKSHPKTMWYNCRLCGKSFVKRYHLRKHIKWEHKSDNETVDANDKHFQCNKCGSLCKTLGEHLQHIEKHKFKTLFNCLINRKVDSLCTICFDKSNHLSNLSEVVHLHGGYPGLTRDKRIEDILTATIPGITLDYNSGNKICETCLNRALSLYIFIFKIHHVRSRLNTCVTVMLDSLANEGNTDNNLMIEISQDTVLPLLKDEFIETPIHEEEVKVEILEDEFRIEISSSESHSSNEVKSDDDDYLLENSLFNPAKLVTRTYSKKKLVNGYQSEFSDNMLKDVCSEFLTFRKQFKPKRVPKCRYTCPFCNKHFISDYFLKKHILKHVMRKVTCNLCSNQFKSKFYLFEHNKMVHVLKRHNYYTCKVCGRSFISSHKMKLHQKCHRFKECQMCDKIFVSQKHYDVHMQRHAVKFLVYKNKHVQTCSFCEKACSNENELSLHVNKVHLQIKPYSCDMCDRQFYTEYNLCSHKKLHSLYSRELCAFCNKTFKCRKDLVIHVRMHIGIKPHNCPVCRQSFYSDSAMKKHMKIFHGGSFCCRLCRTVLPSHLDLKTHINLMHSSM